MDFAKYRNRLLDYLKIQKITDQAGMIHCINPEHIDKYPSCLVSENVFHCYGCGVTGDIFDAIGLLEGIKDKEGQFEFAESVFKKAGKALICPGCGHVSYIAEDFACESPDKIIFFCPNCGYENRFEKFTLKDISTGRRAR